MRFLRGKLQEARSNLHCFGERATVVRRCHKLDERIPTNASKESASDEFWQPLEAALSKMGELIVSADPLPKQLRSFNENEGGFGLRFLAGLVRFFDLFQFGSTAFLLMLARQGWYPGGNMPLGILSEGATLLSSAEEEGNEFLAQYFRSELVRLEDELSSCHPGRADAIRQTCRAHRAESYYVSVPSFLILAEAIARDRGLPSLYEKSRGKKEKKIKDALLSRDEFRAVVGLLAPFLVSVPLDWNPRQRNSYGNPALNRHMILHGECDDYGTEMNSLRTLSHLAYVSDILNIETVSR